MKLTSQVNEEASLSFTLIDQIDGTPLSGYVDADFTKLVLRDGVDETAGTTVVVTEVVAGRYVARFTPNSRGLWYLELTTAGNFGSMYGGYVDVGLFDTVERIRKESNNRHEVDLTNQEEVAYDDDNVTVYQRWPLQTDQGEPVTTQVGVQTRRGAPQIAKP